MFIHTLKRLDRKIKSSEIKWINQETPMGFGDALLKSKNFVGSEPFLLHAGDVYFPRYQFLENFIKKFKNNSAASAILLIQRMKSIKELGIVQLKKNKGEKIVCRVAEKPKKPFSKLAILPIYLFNSTIFQALQCTKTGHNGELQVTDAVDTIMKKRRKDIGI